MVLGGLRGMYECATVAYIHVTDVLLSSTRIRFSFLSLCLIEIAFVVALVAFLTVSLACFLLLLLFLLLLF